MTGREVVVGGGLETGSGVLTGGEVVTGDGVGQEVG